MNKVTEEEEIYGKPVQCKDCSYQMNIEELEIGDDLECDECGCTMEILSIDPPKVKVIDEEK